MSLKVFINGISAKESFILNILITEDEIPDSQDWNNYIADKSKSLNILPIMPDRSLLTKPSSSVYVLPNRSCTLYVLIPVWIQFFAGSGSNTSDLLIEEPSMILSSTWSGEPDNGILSYYFETPVCLNYNDLEPRKHEVICPINISNDSKSQLKIEQLLIQTEHLKIYSDGNILVSNELKVQYKGESGPSNISFGKHVPSFAKDAKQIAVERVQPTDGLLRKSFYKLKSGVGY